MRVEKTPIKALLPGRATRIVAPAMILIAKSETIDARCNSMVGVRPVAVRRARRACARCSRGVAAAYPLISLAHGLRFAGSLPMRGQTLVRIASAVGTRPQCLVAVGADALALTAGCLRFATRFAMVCGILKGVVGACRARSCCFIGVAADFLAPCAYCLRLARRNAMVCSILVLVASASRARSCRIVRVGTDFLACLTHCLYSARGVSVAHIWSECVGWTCFARSLLCVGAQRREGALTAQRLFLARLFAVVGFVLIKHPPPRIVAACGTRSRGYLAIVR